VLYITILQYGIAIQRRGKRRASVGDRLGRRQHQSKTSKEEPTTTIDHTKKVNVKTT
jgi:hypothetical protein